MARRGEKRSEVLYRDRDGRPTSDPADAASGEILHYDGQGDTARRTRFFLRREELPWLPVSEPAFLLWVLVALATVWVGIGIVFELT